MYSCVTLSYFPWLFVYFVAIFFATFIESMETVQVIVLRRTSPVLNLGAS